jgi:uncharacterized protein (TIGR04222 family)
MDTEFSVLAARIASFEFDEPDAMDPFSNRLARDNRWSPEYTARVVVEYKRFLLLAATAEHPVTPSDAVDQAWHLHLLYSADYRRFCRKILGRTLDHGPSRGGALQRAGFMQAYERTLLGYSASFDETPPKDIWPDAEVRFGHDVAFVRVNLEDFWTLRKPEAWRWLAKRITGIVPQKPWVAWLALAAVGCASIAAAALPVSGAGFLGIYVLTWTMTLAAACSLRKWRSTSHATRTSVPELDAYEVAYLGGGSRMALDSALTSLVASGVLVFEPDTRQIHAGTALPAHAPPLEQEVYAEVVRASSLEITAIRRRASELTALISKRLEERGLTSRYGYDVPFWVALIAPIIGGSRAASSLWNHRPALLLVLLCLAGGAVAFVFFRSRSERTRAGEAVLEALKQRHERLRTETAGGAPAAEGTLPIAIGLFGLGVLADSDLAEWSHALSQSGGGEGSEGGCSAADGDGGGGGCGGCGCGGCGG